MATDVFDRDEVRRLARDGALVVEVLPAEEYEHEHLPGAVNIPLERVEPRAVGALDRDRALVLYCNDFT